LNDIEEALAELLERICLNDGEDIEVAGDNPGLVDAAVQEVVHNILRAPWLHPDANERFNRELARLPLGHAGTSSSRRRRGQADGRRGGRVGAEAIPDEGFEPGEVGNLDSGNAVDVPSEDGCVPYRGLHILPHKAQQAVEKVLGRALDKHIGVDRLLTVHSLLLRMTTRVVDAECEPWCNWGEQTVPLVGAVSARAGPTGGAPASGRAIAVRPLWSFG
jgi:hypothetical protein